MKKIDVLDVTKIILSIMVVAIHSELFPSILYPWLRLAVPLFFIISSYLLNKKIMKSPKEEQANIIKHYINRLVKYYLFWFIVLTPITVYARREWLEYGLVKGTIQAVISLFIGSTFIASWFITATIIGTLLINKLSSILNNKQVFIIAFLAYIICCCTSSYSFVFLKMGFPQTNLYNYWTPHCSFPISLIYIFAGKIMAERDFNISKKRNIFLIILFCLLLFIEWFIVLTFSHKLNNDCYFFVFPSSILIFNYLKTIKITIKNSKKLRQLSNFMYPFHASLIPIIRYCLKRLITNEIIIGLICFIITILICYIVFEIVKRKEIKIKILKYSY